MTLESPDENKKISLELGPFQGITDVYFRNCFQETFTGIDRFYTPFFSGIHTANSKNLKTEEIDPECNNIKVLTPQILSNEADEIIRFATQCHLMGYEEINLNMGCPYPQVARKKRGAGLLPFAEHTEQMLNKLTNQLPLSFSIKCRLGYYNKTEIDYLIPLFNSIPLSSLIVHARLGKQMYTGRPDHDKYSEIESLIQSKKVYNGDIFAPEDITILLSKFDGTHTWMLGRGLLADPFLASDIKGMTVSLSSEEKKYIVFHFIQNLYLKRRKARRDNPALIGRMKELWSYLHLSFSESETAWRLIRKSKNFEEYESAVHRIFDEMQWVGHGYQGSLTTAVET